MGIDVLAIALGPTLTALFTGLGVVLRQAWHKRDARQRAHRQLREATDQVAFIRDWMAASKDAGFDQEEELVVRARRDLRAIYERVRVDSSPTSSQTEEPRSWRLVRIFNAVVALRVRVAQREGLDTSAPGGPPSDTARPDLPPAYRKPLGVARLMRPLYWLALIWATFISSAALTAPFNDEMPLWGGVVVAMTTTLLGAVIPAVAIRSFILYLDERAAAKLDSMGVPEGRSSSASSPGHAARGSIPAQNSEAAGWLPPTARGR